MKQTTHNKKSKNKTANVRKWHRQLRIKIQISLSTIGLSQRSPFETKEKVNPTVQSDQSVDCSLVHKVNPTVIWPVSGLFTGSQSKPHSTVWPVSGLFTGSQSKPHSTVWPVIGLFTGSEREKCQQKNGYTMTTFPELHFLDEAELQPS